MAMIWTGAFCYSGRGIGQALEPVSSCPRLAQTNVSASFLFLISLRSLVGRNAGSFLAAWGMITCNLCAYLILHTRTPYHHASSIESLQPHFHVSPLSTTHFTKMGTRTVIKCKSQRIPRDSNLWPQTIANILCQRLWHRDFDHAQDRLQSLGRFDCDGVRCFFLVDNGPPESQQLQQETCQNRNRQRRVAEGERRCGNWGRPGHNSRTCQEPVEALEEYCIECS